MKFLMLAVRDSKMDEFGIPMFFGTEAACVRAVGDQVNKDGPWHDHPEDFELFVVGEYETDFAQVVPMDRPRSVIVLSSLVRG